MVQAKAYYGINFAAKAWGVTGEGFVSLFWSKNLSLRLLCIALVCFFTDLFKREIELGVLLQDKSGEEPWAFAQFAHT